MQHLPSVSALDALFRSPLLETGRFGVSGAQPDPIGEVLPKAYVSSSSRTHTVVHSDYLLSDYAASWYEFLGEPLGARLHVRAHLFALARLFGAEAGVMAPDNETPLASMFEDGVGWDEALARTPWPRVSASTVDFGSGDELRESLWFDDFGDFIWLPGDDLTRARANLRLGDLGVEPLHLRREAKSSRLLTPTRRWEYREDYYDEDRGLEVPFVPIGLSKSPLGPDDLQTLESLAAYLRETLVTYGIDLGDGRKTNDIIGLRLDGTWILKEDFGGDPVLPPAYGDATRQEFDVVVSRANVTQVDLGAWVRQAWSRDVRPRSVYVQAPDGRITMFTVAR